MGYQEVRPKPKFERYVECFWFHRGPELATGEPILPDGCVDIIFSTKKGIPVGLHVVGLMTRPLCRNVEAEEEFFGVRFRPGAASALIPDAPALTDQIEPLESFWGEAARTLREQLANTPAPQQMIERLESFVEPSSCIDDLSLAMARLANPYARLSHVWEMIGTSERSFRRRCLARVGISPKLLARILRFRNAADRIRLTRRERAQPNWAEFATAYGYYDQAHMIREFHEFAGCTPGRFLQYGVLPDLLPSQQHEPSQTE